MQKIAAVFLLTIFSLTLDALPVGNPSDASLLRDGLVVKNRHVPFNESCNAPWRACSFRFGFYGDYVFNQHTQIDQRESDASIHSTKIFTNALFTALNFWDRIDLFTTWGTTELQFETRARVLGGSFVNDIIRFETDTHFSWSIGTRGTIWEKGCFGIGAEAQYFQSNPHLNFIRGELDNPFYFDHREKTHYQEWQFGLGLSYRIPIGPCGTDLVPYMAVKWNRVHISFDRIVVRATTDSYILNNLKNEQGWGYALGMTLVGCARASVTIEGRFANEHAVYANTQFRF